MLQGSIRVWTGPGVDDTAGVSTGAGVGVAVVSTAVGAGVAGGVKNAATKKLCENCLSGIVRSHAGGENWLEKKKELLAFGKRLDNRERRIAGNEGVTTVLLK